MTAIFVFAEDQVVFVASDTKRGNHLGVEPTVARKTQPWTDYSLIAQTGFGEGLARLTGEMLAAQHRSIELSRPGGAARAFEMVRTFRLEYEKHHARLPGLVAGALVVAHVMYIAEPASITVLDWVTGAVTPAKLPVHADGTDQPAFQAIADAEYARLRPGGSGPFDLGEWGKACIAKAKTSKPAGEAVDWPADLTIIRRDPSGWITLSQRVAESTTPHALFRIP